MLERILIVGLGSIGTRHARLVKEMMPNAKIAVLRHQVGKIPPDIAEDLCFTHLDDALRFKPNAAVIANPATHHMQIALQLAQAGIHLLVEKPIAVSVEGVAELIELCRLKNLVLMTGYNLRFLSSLQQFRALLIARRVGRVLSVRAEIGQYLPSWRPDADYRQSVSAKAKLGGGVLLELSHDLDYLRWLFGEVEWVSAIQHKQSSLEIDVEDTAHIVLGFACETGEVPVIAALNMDFIRHDVTRCCTVIGELGTLRWNALTGSVDVYEQGAQSWTTLFTRPQQRDESYLAQLQHFLGSIATGDLSVTSGEDGLAVIQIIDAARRSSSSGTIAKMELVGRGNKNPQENQ